MTPSNWISPLLTCALAITLSACGSEDENPDGAGGSANTGGTGGQVPTGCPDHPNVATGSTGECRLTAPLSAPMTQDLTLDASNEWYLEGPLVVGNDTETTVLTIEPGTTVYGGDGSFILIQRASQIVAEGTKENPIVLTSAKPIGNRGTEDWGGLVINGRAPINNAANPDGSAPGEAGTGQYGGNVADDNSGVLRFVRVEFAGNKVDLENELNGFAFQGVGSGTTVEYIQAHMTSDDGVEFFGGTVNVRYLVVTGSDDDSVDWTGGWTGKAQFVVAKQLPESGTEAERGIEADNLKGTNSATPYSNPTLSNVTLIARDGNGKQGVMVREGTKGKLHNMIISGFGVCVKVDHPQTEANVDDASLALANVIYDCGATTEDGNKAADLVGEEMSTRTASPSLEGAMGWMPASGSPALGIGEGPSDTFFVATDYAGAFDGVTDWTEGWIETATK